MFSLVFVGEDLCHTGMSRSGRCSVFVGEHLCHTGMSRSLGVGGVQSSL